jgi:hypothetical protein
MMEKINCFFSPEEMTWLRKRAERLGLTVAEVLRRIVDAARGAK